MISITNIADLTVDILLPMGEELVVDLASGGHWYGHGFSHVQPYPLESGEVVNETFAVNNIQSPVWMCSKGTVLFADTVAPLQVAINRDGDGLLRVSCPSETFTLRVFRGSSLPEAHAAWLQAVDWPNAAPDVSLFGDSLFCTWTQYPRCITQERILDMARQIRANDYPCSKLLIDDRWERCFGELQFAEKDFPDPHAMFAELQEMGFEAWLWVTPFVNREAACFEELAKAKVLVPSRSADGAAVLQWWGGKAGLVDVTAPQGRDWYRQKLEALLDLGAVGFKIDGGDHKYHPPTDDCVWYEDPGASGYSDKLLALFEDLVPNRCETRTAWMSQGRSIIWREGGKDSHWGADNGLKAMVSLGLNLGLLGYDLLIPDMVPGRVQTMNSEDPLPTDELMIRWTEASAFFPFLQFSYFPWNYGEATAAAVLGYANVHKAIEGYIAEQARSRTKPLLRPVWYDWPEESSNRCRDPRLDPRRSASLSRSSSRSSSESIVTTIETKMGRDDDRDNDRDEDTLYTIPDQFMLGSDLLVAPVLDPGVTERDVLLPPGEWVDAWTGKRVSGVLRQCPAPCPGIPVFVRGRNEELTEVLRAALGAVQRGCVPPGVTTATWQAGLDRDLSVTG